MKKYLLSISALIIILFISSPYLTKNPTASSKTLYLCTYVIDGDTIVVLMNGKKEKVRLIGVDAPEKKNPYTKEEHFGKESAAFVKEITEYKKVRLKYGRQMRDKYGRILAYVYFEDGTFLNAEIIRQGYGKAYRRFAFKYMDNFKKHELEAKKNKRGLWKERAGVIQ